MGLKINLIFHQEFVYLRQKGEGSTLSKTKAINNTIISLTDDEKNILLQHLIMSHIDEKSGNIMSNDEFNRSFKIHFFMYICLICSFWLDIIITTSIIIVTILILPLVLVTGGIKK